MILTEEARGNYRNLIIDLGGVLFAIDVARSVEAFARLATRPVDDPARIIHHPLFERFERGELGPQEFRSGLREQLGLAGTDADLDAAWNALLLGVIPGRDAMMGRLAHRWNIVLLSNTNQIHYDALEEECRTLFSQFGECYFSFRMGRRKPEPEIYLQVLREQGWQAGETLMIDDGVANVQAAESLGMGGLLYQSGSDWARWMGEWNEEASHTY